MNIAADPTSTCRKSSWPGHYLVFGYINSLPGKLPEIYLRLRR